FGSFLLFNPVDTSPPEVKMLDRRMEKHWEEVIKKYHSAVQNYRIISRGKKTGWPQREILHSSAAVGLDRSDQVLFIHSSSPHSIHDFIRMVLKLPLHIANAMYVEGGPEAELYIPYKKNRNSSCLQSMSLTPVASPFRIPNVIGITKR
ncbi:MAG: phosphodiester glycosidase family protein, partial [Deltaproteobacteria bacterium]|nr:phosphodiester glycosidase family protein [Deltaproteobacteria bacterium]